MKKYAQDIIKAIGINTFMAAKNQLHQCTGAAPAKFYERLKANKKSNTPAKDAGYFFRNELNYHFKEFSQYQ